MADDDHSTLDDFDVIRTVAELEAHMTHRRLEPAWLLLSPSLLPGSFLLEHARGQHDAIGTLCRALEVQFEALAAGDPENMVRGFFLMAPLMEGLYGRALKEVAREAGKRGRAAGRRAAIRTGLRLLIRRGTRRGKGRLYEIEVPMVDPADDADGEGDGGG